MPKDYQPVTYGLQRLGDVPALLKLKLTLEQRMAQPQQENKGVLFPVREKKTPKSPDYKGEVNIGGSITKLAAWKQRGPYGEFITMAVDNWKPNQQQYPREYNPDANRPESDVPF